MTDGAPGRLPDDPTVVVGVPTYDNEDSIGPTLEMLLGQTRLPDRIVVCDKSSDATREVVRDHAEATDVAVEIIDQTGDGVADAYDEILAHVAGEYDLLATIQTDLAVDDDWLEGHLRIHRDHPEIDLVTGDDRANDPTDREVDPDERPYYVGRNFSAKADVLERIDGWDTNFLRGEDWDMRIRLAGAGVRVYACTDLGYTWLQEDPYITLSKATRRPTSVTFLAKYGAWYLRFHPSHVVADGLGLAGVLALAVAVLAAPVSPPVAVLAATAFGASVVAYYAGHYLARGSVQGEWVVGPLKKQLLTGIGVLAAVRRVVLGDVEWNRTGFDPDAIPDYKF